MAVNKCWRIAFFSTFCFARRGANSEGTDRFTKTLSCSSREMAKKKTARPTGDTISMLDAMKYNSFSAYKPCNVGYSVVAEFIRQNSLCKRNQLKICRGTSSWNPSFLMTYYSEPELLAIEQVFTQYQVLPLWYPSNWTISLGTMGKRPTSIDLPKSKERNCLKMLWACASEESADPSSSYSIFTLSSKRVTELKTTPLSNAPTEPALSVQKWAGSRD